MSGIIERLSQAVRRNSGPVPGLEARIASFREVLHANNQALGAIASIQELLAGERVATAGEVRRLVAAVTVQTYRMIANLNRMTGDRFKALGPRFDEVKTKAGPQDRGDAVPGHRRAGGAARRGDRRDDRGGRPEERLPRRGPAHPARQRARRLRDVRHGVPRVPRRRPDLEAQVAEVIAGLDATDVAACFSRVGADQPVDRERPGPPGARGGARRCRPGRRRPSRGALRRPLLGAPGGRAGDVVRRPVPLDAERAGGRGGRRVPPGRRVEVLAAGHHLPARPRLRRRRGGDVLLRAGDGRGGRGRGAVQRLPVRRPHRDARAGGPRAGDLRRGRLRGARQLPPRPRVPAHRRAPARPADRGAALRQPGREPSARRSGRR